ncbi:hypothetical protein F4821DRAFT_251801 [Hypoxylon rubiginosum]|uniref:Uncharacterized protein n=1 Tax=Hypoxylon rubiginosum TaxID=110542 RepID=A0ACC0CIR5_9PEZI|nr:hypothetical protein F4821DRAFT_251801 [Hypoxylon rubiginosum]
MLSHLRFHRRGPSNPSSPVPENNPWDTASLQPAQLVPEDGIPTPEIRPRSATSVPFAHGHGQPPPQPVPTLSHPIPPQPQSPPPPPPQLQPQPQQYEQPPVLPPIARISSAESDLSIDLGNFEPRQRDEPKPLPRSPYNESSSFIGGLALQNYRREQAALRPGSIDRNATNVSDPASFKPHAGAGTANFSSRPPPPVRPVKAASSFAATAPAQNAPATTGKRPPGVKMTSEPHVVPTQTAAPDVPRGKKSLPFLKNPLPTLLMRRKTSQNMPELTLPIRRQVEEPVYDPRIRGTRIHDFSAPRPRKVVSTGEPTSLGAEKSRHDAVSPTIEYNSPVAEAPPVPPKDDNSQSTRTSSTYSQTISIDATLSQRSQDSGDSQSNAGAKIDWNSQRRKSSIPPSIMSLSRNVSEASARDVLSSLPKHMKSTSSRFSFDMVGAAKQEKLLEERHRQRQQDRKVDEDQAPRDSRFDDFDEDAFDYDAMDYDDGLEERIPGVNADYDEEDDGFGGMDDDPDNDQENFAGFVFSRSNPVSELTSPQGTGLLPTPRDASGNVIGYAMTEDELGASQPMDDSTPAQDESVTELPSKRDTPTGLGIQIPQQYEHPHEVPHEIPQQVPQPRTLNKDDELYFNDGLIHDFDGEGDGSAFDESIFDLEDTDRYGRPIPGLFANALSQRQAVEQTKKRESDMTSRLSAQSALSQSTAHTSLSADLQSKPTEPREPGETFSIKETLPIPGLHTTEQEQDQTAAYQAALAEAAHQAAASGKFRRDSSPTPPAELTITSPTTSGSSQTHSHPEELHDHEYDDDLPSGLDDYELDDDDIIAEANASALANDSDGWYGQEFGFYSAPTTVNTHHIASALSEKNLYQYSHGGYFGPSGVNRTTSGRVVSREPNLTPITERSEYSNRNSIMSLGVPQSANPNAPLQSPGLAQLAMMADDDNMSLSALLRLRSKAWGGSQASLVSSRDGSPSDRNGAVSPWNHEQLGMASHGRKNSAFSIFSQDSTGPGSDAGSPTLTLSMSGIPNSAIPPLGIPSNSNPVSATSPMSAPVFSPMQSSSVCPPVFEDEELSPLDERKPEGLSGSTSASGASRRPFNENMSPVMGMPSQKRPGMGHRHRGSADSISYTKEEESGETRWIMERRRTAESGEIEILGRQIVERGRI